MLQRRRGTGFHEVHESDSRDRPQSGCARVQPGVVLDTLRKRAEVHQLTFAPDPSTHSRCTIGGMIGNNSCGTHSLLGGKTVDNVEELRVLLYDGSADDSGRNASEANSSSSLHEGGRRGRRFTRSCERFETNTATLIRARYPQIPRRVSGYNLDQLFPERGFHVARSLVGTEGTCADGARGQVETDTEPATQDAGRTWLRGRVLAADHVPEILEFQPIGLEGLRRKHCRWPQEEKTRRTWNCFPKEAASCWSNLAPTMQDETIRAPGISLTG